jgi:hypothetical protein
MHSIVIDWIASNGQSTQVRIPCPTVEMVTKEITNITTLGFAAFAGEGIASSDEHVELVIIPIARICQIVVWSDDEPGVAGRAAILGLQRAELSRIVVNNVCGGESVK